MNSSFDILNFNGTLFPNATNLTDLEFYHHYYYYYEYEDHTDSGCIDNFMYSNDHKDLPGYVVFFNSFLPVVCICGIVGIILTVVVLSRKNMSTSTNCYLTSLAIADLGFLTIMSTKLFNQAYLSNIEHYKYAIYLEYANIFLHTFLLASVWMTVMLAVERYIAICHPLRAISICTLKRARIIIVFIFLFSFLCRIPNFFEITIQTGYTCTGTEVRYIKYTSIGMNMEYRIYYTWIIDCILCGILPFLALAYFNIRLIIEIHKSTKYLRCHIGTDSNMQTMVSSEQMKITMMLIGIIIVFFVCQAPLIAAMAFRHVHRYQFTHDYMNTMEVYNIINSVTITLLALKSAFNFIVYCWFSEKFWNTFKRVFCHKKCVSKQKLQRKSHTHTVHSADQNGTNSIRKTSYLTKDTIC